MSTGTTLTPSEARNTPSPQPSPCAVWFPRIVTAFVAFFGALAVYLFSFGPIARLYGANPYNVGSRLPLPLRLLYCPMDHIPMPDALAATLRRYNYWWMALDRQQKDFLTLMARIDSLITPGMTYSSVVAAIGQPMLSDKPGDQLFSTYYHFQPPAVDYGLITNGFTIVFSNGVVLRKLPVTSSMGR